MEKILSQDEINALFSTMATDAAVLEQPAAGNGAEERSVSSYDFCRSDCIPKEHVRAIQNLHSQFARSLTSSLSAYLRALVEVTLTSVDQGTYQEYLKQLPDPTLFCALSMPPMRGSLAIEFSPTLVFPIIDMLLGGTGSSPQQNRTLTEIEMQVMEGVIKIVLGDLKEAWRPLMEISPRLDSRETRPQMLQIVAPGEAVVALRFDIKVGENAGMINLCIPSVVLKMNRVLFDHQRRQHPVESGSEEPQRIRSLLRSARLDIFTAIHDRSLVVEDLLRVDVGDIIQLNHPVGDPIVLSVGGVPKFCGRIVARRGRRAFEITDSFVA